MQPNLSFALIAIGKMQSAKERRGVSLAQFHKVFPGQLLNEPL